MQDRQATDTLASLVLRLVLASVFLYHGLHKISPATGWGTQWDFQTTAWDWIGLQGAIAWGEVVLGGVALALGLLTRVAAAGGVLVQVAIAYRNSLQGDFFNEKSGGGWELNLCLAAMCLALTLIGPGAVSLDRLLFRRRPKPQESPKPPAEPALVASGAATGLEGNGPARYLPPPS